MSKEQESTNNELMEEEILNQIEQDIRKQTIEEREDIIKQLKMIHSMDLDAISCKSLEDFMIWSEHRKDLLKHLNNK